MQTSNTAKIRKMTLMSVLCAIIIIIAFVPLKTLGLEITFTMVPIAVGACVMGPAAGALLGGVFGIVSFLQCLGYSQFGVVLFGINPLYTFIVCVPTRILAGYLAGLIFRLINKNRNHENIACAVTGIAAPALNTLLFMSALVFLFYNTEYIQGFASALGAVNPIHFIVLFVGINGLVEIICGFIIAFPVTKAVLRSLK